MNQMTGAEIRADWEEKRKLFPHLTPILHATMWLGLPYRVYAARLETDKLKLSATGTLFNQFDLGDPWKLEGDWMVCGDVHVPFTHWDLAVNVAQVGRKAGIRKLLVAGDLFEFEHFSTYAQLVQTPTWAQERDATRELLSMWLKTFDEIKILMGNHDRRLQKFTQGAFEETDILALVTTNDKVRMSNFGHCEIVSGDVKWRITHPRNYSVNNLVVAETLAMKYQCNIISGHEHHLSMGVTRYGKFIAVNMGCLVDASKLSYVSLDDSKAPDMIPGFTMLRGGAPYLFGEQPFTNWQEWL